jgi:hypothetical protein
LAPFLPWQAPGDRDRRRRPGYLRHYLPTMSRLRLSKDFLSEESHSMEEWLLLYFWLCAYLMSRLSLVIMLLQRLSVIDIILVLYILFIDNFFENWNWLWVKQKKLVLTCKNGI